MTTQGDTLALQYALDEMMSGLQEYANEGGIGADAFEGLGAAQDFATCASMYIEEEDDLRCVIWTVIPPEAEGWV